MKSIKSKEVAVLLIGPFNDTFDYLIEEIEITEQKESITISISNHTLPSDFFEQAEPFRQLNRDTQEQQGSGLGIYLCKELAKRNAWELSHAYQNGQSTISLRIKT